MQTKPLLVLAIAAGALLIARRQKAQRTALTGPPAKTTADYFTPTDIAAALGGLVVGLTKNIATPAPAGIFNVTGPIAPAAPGGSAADGTLGWNTYGNGAPSGDPYNPDPPSWMLSGPARSQVNDPSISRLSSSVDQIVAAPVYDISTNFDNNPLASSSTSAGGFSLF